MSDIAVGLSHRCIEQLTEVMKCAYASTILGMRCASANEEKKL
ncbi:hypothetical protein [Bordetella ansorpii]|nr:hypothetical protein [Bordetella ansorpii]